MYMQRCLLVSDFDVGSSKNLIVSICRLPAYNRQQSNRCPTIAHPSSKDSGQGRSSKGQGQGSKSKQQAQQTTVQQQGQGKHTPS